MNLNKRLEKIERRTNSIRCFIILQNAYELPQISINGTKAYFKSKDQMNQFTKQFEDDIKLLIFHTVYTPDWEPTPIPKDAKYVEGWDANANFNFSNPEYNEFE